MINRGDDQREQDGRFDPEMLGLLPVKSEQVLLRSAAQGERDARSRDGGRILLTGLAESEDPLTRS